MMWGMLCHGPKLTPLEMVLMTMQDILSTLIPVLIFAFLYKTRVADQRSPFPDPVSEKVSMQDPPHDFRNKFLDCLYFPHTCLHACCCGAVRAADTLSVTGLMSFWHVVAVFCVIDMLPALCALCINLASA